MSKLHTLRRQTTKWKDRIKGGLADPYNPSDFDPDQLAKGIRVEMEHTDDPELAEEIAMDHLVEHPDYYDRLLRAKLNGKRRGWEEKIYRDGKLYSTVHWDSLEHFWRDVDIAARREGEGNEQLETNWRQSSTRASSHYIDGVGSRWALHFTRING